MASKVSAADKDLCRMVTPKFRVSYPHVFKPQQVKPTDKPKYSITMLYPKDSDLMGHVLGSDEERSLKDVIRNAKIAEFGPKKNWPEDLESPVIDGDVPDKKGEIKEGYAGHWVIKATTNEDSRPGVVDEEGIPISPEDGATQFYPGCYARAYVYARVWEYMGKQGVQFILDHVQKLGDGKSFGGKKPVDQVFGPTGASKGKKSKPADDDDEEDFR